MSQELIEIVRREREAAIAREPAQETARHALQVTRATSPLIYTASCSCGLWALENQKLSHPIDLEGIRNLVGPRHVEHVLKEAGRKV
jgi:hypothetical protein